MAKPLDGYGSVATWTKFPSRDCWYVVPMNHHVNPWANQERLPDSPCPKFPQIPPGPIRWDPPRLFRGPDSYGWELKLVSRRADTILIWATSVHRELLQRLRQECSRGGKRFTLVGAFLAAWVSGPCRLIFCFCWRACFRPGGRRGPRPRNFLQAL